MVNIKTYDAIPIKRKHESMAERYDDLYKTDGETSDKFKSRSLINDI